MSSDPKLEERAIDPFAKASTQRADGLPEDQRPEEPRNTEASPAQTAQSDGRLTTAAIANAGRRESPGSSLLDANESDGFRTRWEQCQQHFVDEPKASVQSADELVAEVMQRVAQQFGATRESLEQQWGRGDNASTEDLRLAMQQYREFFNRLLAV